MTDSSYAIHPSADEDIDEIAEYFIEQGVPEIAWRFIDAVHESALSTLANPRLYSAHPHYGDIIEGLRRCPVRGFERYTMYYGIEPDESMIIMAVLPGMRNHPKLIKGRGPAADS